MFTRVLFDHSNDCSHFLGRETGAPWGEDTGQVPGYQVAGLGLEPRPICEELLTLLRHYAKDPAPVPSLCTEMGLTGCLYTQRPQAESVTSTKHPSSLRSTLSVVMTTCSQ